MLEADWMKEVLSQVSVTYETRNSLLFYSSVKFQLDSVIFQ